MCRMNPRVSPQHQVATVNQVPGMQDNATAEGGGKAVPLDMPQGKNKGSKVSGCSPEAIVGAAVLSSSGEESGNFAVIRGVPI